MAYPAGFTYVRGTRNTFWSTVSSTATFRAGNPVTYSDDRSLIEAASDTTAIVGIALHNAADSLGGGRVNQCLVLIPASDTVFATLVQTGVATSATSVGQSYNLEKSGNFLRLDTDSQTSPRLVIVPRADGSTVDSEDSSVFVQFLMDFVAPFGSNASVNIFAQD